MMVAFPIPFTFCKVLSCIGCVCVSTRFSRKVLWLKMSSTNRDPRVISRYYLECVESCGGMSKC